MDSKPKNITNYFNLIIKKVNFGSEFQDINKLIGSYVFHKRFFRFVNIFPVHSLEPNELIRANTIVEGYTRSNAIKHLEWILNNFYPDCIWLKHKKYPDIKKLLRDKAVDPQTPKEVNKIRRNRIYNSSQNRSLPIGNYEGDCKEIVHFMNTLPKIFHNKFYYDLPIDNPLYVFNPSIYYPKLINHLITTHSNILNDNYEFELKYFTREVIIYACSRNIESLKFIPLASLNQEIANEIIRANVQGITSIPVEYINIENFIDFINTYTSRYARYGYESTLSAIINKINPSIVMGAISRNEKYLNAITYAFSGHSISKYSSELVKMILNKFPHTIKTIGLYANSDYVRSNIEKYSRLFKDYGRDTCIEFINHVPQVLKGAPPDYFNKSEIISVIQSRRIPPGYFPIETFTKEICELLHASCHDMFLAIIEAHPRLLKLFTIEELKTKYFSLFDTWCSDYTRNVPDDFFDESTIRTLINKNKGSIHFIPSDKITVELCKEFLDNGTFSIKNVPLSIYSKMFAAKLRTNEKFIAKPGFPEPYYKRTG